MYDTLYWEGEVATTAKCVLCDISDEVVSETSEMSSSSAVTFWSEHSLPLESLSSTRTCVGWLAMADDTPGPLARHVYW